MGDVDVLVKNTVEQPAYMYHSKQNLYISTYKGAHMHYVLERLSACRRHWRCCMATLDILVRDNGELQAAWQN